MNELAKQDHTWTRRSNEELQDQTGRITSYRQKRDAVIRIKTKAKPVDRPYVSRFRHMRTYRNRGFVLRMCRRSGCLIARPLKVSSRKIVTRLTPRPATAIVQASRDHHG